MSLRILGGALRGRVLKTPKGAPVRPTTGLLKKSFFDICKDRIVETNFLDLFAGSGAIGIEALSRGAAHATFIDSDRRSILCIQENLRALKLEEQATLLTGDVETVLRRLEEMKKKYDLIYIDPPYEKNTYHPELLTLLDGMELARHADIFIEEAYPSPWEKQPIPLKHFICKDRRHFGRSILHQYLPVS
ncbi:MAG: 16S rRNA (guanine(966)-N(2))-methyltransferase RsmD [Chlamydiales bacterium]|nr:16S rRNA (guanine(966)-N(2))-methyltransferase RsmD [Chlamydiales bacterium]